MSRFISVASFSEVVHCHDFGKRSAERGFQLRPDEQGRLSQTRIKRELHSAGKTAACDVGGRQNSKLQRPRLRDISTAFKNDVMLFTARERVGGGQLTTIDEELRDTRQPHLRYVVHPETITRGAKLRGARLR